MHKTAKPVFRQAVDCFVQPKLPSKMMQKSWVIVVCLPVCIHVYIIIVVVMVSYHMGFNVCAAYASHSTCIFNIFVEQCSRNFFFMYVDIFLDLVAKCISFSLSHICDGTEYNENSFFFFIISYCTVILFFCISLSLVDRNHRDNLHSETQWIDCIELTTHDRNKNLTLIYFSYVVKTFTGFTVRSFNEPYTMKYEMKWNEENIFYLLHYIDLMFNFSGKAAKYGYDWTSRFQEEYVRLVQWETFIIGKIQCLCQHYNFPS